MMCTHAMGVVPAYLPWPASARPGPAAARTSLPTYVFEIVCVCEGVLAGCPAGQVTYKLLLLSSQQAALQLLFVCGAGRSEKGGGGG